MKSGSPFRWPTKQACIKHPCTRVLSSSPTGLYIYIYIPGNHAACIIFFHIFDTLGSGQPEPNSIFIY